MGIDGLLPALRSVSRAAHISEYRGQRVAVDSYVWLHRGVFTCARELALGQATDKYVDYFLRCVQLLQSAGVEPLLVFDGGKLPSKAGEEAERERRAAAVAGTPRCALTRSGDGRRRAENLARAREHVASGLTYARVRAGNHAAAQECFSRAVDVSPLMAARVIGELRRRGLAFIVAPFEADAQMAWLAHQGYVAAVVTEDSDLVAYGTPRVFLKLDLKSGAGVEVAAAQLPRCRELNLGGLTADQFTQLCVLAGCDFLPSIPGVGIKKAATLVRRFRSAPAAVRHLRFEGAPVPPGYEAALAGAMHTFAHAFVYDPEAKACVHRTPLGDTADALAPDNVPALLGVPPPGEQAAGVAEGWLCPMTLEPFPEAAFARVSPAAARQARPAVVSPARNRLQMYFRPLVTAPEAAEDEAAAEAAEEAPAAAESPPAAPPSRPRATTVFTSMLNSILGGSAGPTPSRAPLSIYSPADRRHSGASDSASREDPSPLRAHPLAWPASAAAAPLPVPGGGKRAAGSPRSASAPQRAPPPPAAVFSPPSALPAAPRAKFASPFFTPPARLRVEEECDPEPTSPPPELAVDVRHVAASAAVASAALDARLEAFRKGGAGPLRSLTQPKGGKRHRSSGGRADGLVEPVLSPAAAALESFRFKR